MGLPILRFIFLRTYHGKITFLIKCKLLLFGFLWKRSAGLTKLNLKSPGLFYIANFDGSFQSYNILLSEERFFRIWDNVFRQCCLHCIWQDRDDVLGEKGTILKFSNEKYTFSDFERKGFSFWAMKFQHGLQNSNWGVWGISFQMKVFSKRIDWETLHTLSEYLVRVVKATF